MASLADVLAATAQANRESAELAERFQPQLDLCRKVREEFRPQMEQAMEAARAAHPHAEQGERFQAMIDAGRKISAVMHREVMRRQACQRRRRVQLPLARQRRSRGCAARTRGSRRTTSRSAGGGSSGDDDGGGSEPPGGPLTSIEVGA